MYLVNYIALITYQIEEEKVKIYFQIDSEVYSSQLCIHILFNLHK